MFYIRVSLSTLMMPYPLGEKFGGRVLLCGFVVALSGGSVGGAVEYQWVALPRCILGGNSPM